MFGVSLGHSGLHTGISDDPHQARSSPEEGRLHAGLHPGDTQNTHAQVQVIPLVPADPCQAAKLVNRVTSGVRIQKRKIEKVCVCIKVKPFCCSNSGTNIGYSPCTGQKYSWWRTGEVFI